MINCISKLLVNESKLPLECFIITNCCQESPTSSASIISCKNDLGVTQALIFQQSCL